LIGIEFRGKGGERGKREGVSSSFCGNGPEDEREREDLWFLLYEKGEAEWIARGFEKVREGYPPRSIHGAWMGVRAELRWSSLPRLIKVSWARRWGLRFLR
jgi:hypothetical protein